MRRALLVLHCDLRWGDTGRPVPHAAAHQGLTGDAMAHAILPGAAIGYLISGLSLGAMTIGGLIAGMAVALLSGFVTRVTAQREDAGLAAFYLISLALGVLIVSTRGGNVDLMHVLFGTVLALNDATLFLLARLRASRFWCWQVCFSRLSWNAQITIPAIGEQPQRDYAPNFPSTCCAEFGQRISRAGHADGSWNYDPAGCTAKFLSPLIGGLLAAINHMHGHLSSFCGLLLSYHFSLPSGPAIILWRVSLMFCRSLSVR